MKKSITLCLIIFVFASSFMQKERQIAELDGYILLEEVLDPSSTDPEIIVSAYKHGIGIIVISVCPGTGFACIIRGTAKDGDPVTYTSLKGKNNENIEIYHE